VTATYQSLGDAYLAGLALVLEGDRVQSVRDELSKASNFGRGDRPSREIRAYTFTVSDPRQCLVSSALVPINLPYCFGLLAWTLDGRNEVSDLSYYRSGAAEFSDDGRTLSGAFGHRLFGTHHTADQLRAILGRLRADPAHRRTYASILRSQDNFIASREYPCAAGLQLFLRDGALHLLAVMRAQQALTVLPYDAFLFMCVQNFLAGELEVSRGNYHHFSGTYHAYESEMTVVAETVSNGVGSARVPAIPPGKATSARDRLVALEGTLRSAAASQDVTTLDRLADAPDQLEFVEIARAILCTYAYRKLSIPKTVAPTCPVDPALSAMAAD
jgi:thymidylate synthase